MLAAALATVEEDERPGRIAQTLGRAGFADGRAAVEALSGGWRKRLAIARELAGAPDVLLMDEPTNHLDVDGILWLEGILADRARAVLVVSHDRYFLEHVATRMLELNRAYPDGLFQTDGGYSEFLARRDEFLRGQAAYEESLANTVRREIEWLRRGAKARSTKAKGRIREAGRLIEELGDARARAAGGTAGIELPASARRTRKLLVARGLSKALGGRPLIRDLDLAIVRGTHVGLIGPNGSGKTTLLDLLAGTLAPDAGEIERAEGLRLVRFDQHRASLDPDQSLRRALSPEGDAVVFQGRSIHVASWAKRFLFRPEQLELPVGRLSGGEQARILIARLMREPADLLDPGRADERPGHPDARGSRGQPRRVRGRPRARHPRPLHARARVQRHPGPRRRRRRRDVRGLRAVGSDPGRPGGGAARDQSISAAASTRARPRTKRLGYLDQREWDGMERAILDAENAVEACRRAAEDPGIASDPAALQTRYAALQAARVLVDRLYARWAELEAKQPDGYSGAGLRNSLTSLRLASVTRTEGSMRAP